MSKLKCENMKSLAPIPPLSSVAVSSNTSTAYGAIKSLIHILARVLDSNDNYFM